MIDEDDDDDDDDNLYVIIALLLNVLLLVGVHAVPLNGRRCGATLCHSME